RRLRQILAQSPQHVAFLEMPANIGRGVLRNPAPQNGAPQREPIQAGTAKDRRVRLPRERGVDVLHMDPPQRELPAVRRLGHVRLGAEDLRGLRDGVLKAKTLESMER